MKFNQLLNELQAEITNGKIPANKIFFNNKMLEGDALKKFLNSAVGGSTWLNILQDIMVKLRSEPEHLKGFSPDKDPLDIDGDSVIKTGKVFLNSDSGVRYEYDIKTKKLVAKK